MEHEILCTLSAPSDEVWMSLQAALSKLWAINPGGGLVCEAMIWRFSFCRKNVPVSRQAMNIYSRTDLFLRGPSFFHNFAFCFDTSQSFSTATTWRPIRASLWDASLSFYRALVAWHIASPYFLFGWGPHHSYLCREISTWRLFWCPLFLFDGCCNYFHFSTVCPFRFATCGLSLLRMSLLACCLSFFLLVPALGNLSHWCFY